MDVDEEDHGEGPSTSGARSVVSPGETITSAREYMRYIWALRRMPRVLLILQRSRDIR